MKHKAQRTQRKMRGRILMVVPVHKSATIENKEIPSRDFSCSSFSVTSVPPCFKIFLVLDLVNLKGFPASIPFDL